MSAPTPKRVTPGYRSVLVTEAVFERLRSLQSVPNQRAFAPGARVDGKHIATVVVQQGLASLPEHEVYKRAIQLMSNEASSRS
jgi:hypothetical protein